MRDEMAIRAALAGKVDRLALSRYLDRVAKTDVVLGPGSHFKGLNLDDAREIGWRLVDEAVEFLANSGLRSIVVPFSGGADSTLMGAILDKAADRYNAHGGSRVPIIGFVLPCKLQADAEAYDDLGLLAARLYADEVTRIDLGPLHTVILEQLFIGERADSLRFESGTSLLDLAHDLRTEEGSPSLAQAQRVVAGSMAARLRMIFCYGWAALLQGAQCSTDNLTEALTGFWTLCGDEGTFKLIQCLLKGLEQPPVMAALGVPDIYIVQPPTDGLGVGDGDVAQLYGSLFTGKEDYVDVDTVLLRYFAGMEYPDPLFRHIRADDHPVVRWHCKTQFKRTPFCVGRSRAGLPAIKGSMTYNT